jgi:DNA-binding phage protein
MGIEADLWGHGGIAAVARATGAARNTVKRGMEEAADPSLGPACG